MQIYKGTGVTETPELLIQKGIGALVVGASVEFSTIKDEVISIYIEKAGKNKDIARDVLLKDFMLLGSYGEDAIQPLYNLKCSAFCELTEDGGYIQLGENETIKFKLKNLNPLHSYELHGIEEPLPSSEILMFERKTMASELLQQDYDVKGYDLASITHHNSITEFALTYDNGAVVKYTPIELEALERSLDPLQVITDSGEVFHIQDRWQIPLKGIVNLNIRKGTGALLNIHLRIDEGDKLLYQNH